MPTYNEKDNLERLVKNIFALGLDIKILIVDDNSPDGTGILADKMAMSDSRISVLHRAKKDGLGKAYLDGFGYAIKNIDADYIMEMDADLSHDPIFIPKFIEGMKECDVIVGSRFCQGRISITNWSLIRLAFSYSASIYVRLFTRLNMTDPTSGFKCFKRYVIESILTSDIVSSGYAFQIEVNYICKEMGFKIKELPIIFYGRDKGLSKMRTFNTILDAIAIVWILKFKKFSHIINKTSESSQIIS